MDKQTQDNNPFKDLNQDPPLTLPDADVDAFLEASKKIIQGFRDKNQDK